MEDILRYVSYIFSASAKCFQSSLLIPWSLHKLLRRFGASKLYLLHSRYWCRWKAIGNWKRLVPSCNLSGAVIKTWLLIVLILHSWCRATNFTQTPKKNKNEFWNCHLEMLGRVAEPIFTSLCPGQPLRVWVCWGSKSGTAWEALAISRPSLRGPQPRDVDALACAKEL